MNKSDQVATVVDCQQAINRFFHALDGHDFAACAASIAADGIWHRKGNPLVGPDAVLADLSGRGPETVSMHMITNCVVTPTADGQADARYYALVYRCDNHVGAPGTAAPLVAPVSILIYEDRLVKVVNDWLVAERRSRRVFAS